MTELEQFLEDEKETCEALLNTMFLDLGQIEVSMKNASEKAKKFEKARDSLRAKIWHKIAVGLAIYEGDVKKGYKNISANVKNCCQKQNIPLWKFRKSRSQGSEYYRKNLEA